MIQRVRLWLTRFVCPKPYHVQRTGGRRRSSGTLTTQQRYGMAAPSITVTVPTAFVGPVFPLTGVGDR